MSLGKVDRKQKQEKQKNQKHSKFKELSAEDNFQAYFEVSFYIIEPY